MSKPDYKDLAYRISVMRAALAGKKIEYRNATSRHAWASSASGITWDWYQNDYRVKQEPFEARLLINRETGGVRHVSSAWLPINIKLYTDTGWELVTVVEKK